MHEVASGVVSQTHTHAVVVSLSAGLGPGCWADCSVHGTESNQSQLFRAAHPR